VNDEDIELDDTPRRRSARTTRRGATRQQAPGPKFKYMEQLQEVANRERKSVVIDLQDLKEVRSYLGWSALNTPNLIPHPVV
jgi:DNA replication licensing factor MCM7